jgi:hypothetical protein
LKELTMKKTLVSALILAAAFGTASAYADNLEPNDASFQGVYGQVDPNAPTRAQIVQELEAAGPINNAEPDNATFDAVYGQVDPNTPTRAQVERQLESPHWQNARLDNKIIG